MNNLAVLYLDAGRVAEAIRENQATLKLMKSKLGPDDTTTLGTRGNLAVRCSARRRA